MTYPRGLVNRRISWRQKLPNLVSLKVQVGRGWKEYSGSDLKAAMLFLEIWQMGQGSPAIEIAGMD
jgi:hypothetical protein